MAQGTSAGNAALLLGLPGGAIKVPAGLLVPRQSVLRVSAFWSKLGGGPIDCVTCFGSTNAKGGDGVALAHVVAEVFQQRRPRPRSTQWPFRYRCRPTSSACIRARR